MSTDQGGPVDMDRMPASNVDAERWVLAAMMAAPLAVEQAVEIIAPADFYRPGHGDMFLAMISMHACQEPITPVTLRAWIERDGVPSSLRTQWPAYLLDIYGLPVHAWQAAAHARIVWECSVRRKIEEAGARLVQQATSYSDDPAQMIYDALAAITRLADRSQTDDGGAMTTRRFLALDSSRFGPVIPGLLDHQDRAVVVGGEGSGKTTLAYQVAYGLAAGVHPFTYDQIPPGRVLILDLEQPGGILQRRLHGFRAVAERSPGWAEDHIAVWSRPAGIDLERADDAFRVAELCRRAEPDLIVAGPVYKMIREREHSEHQHAAVTRFFDAMRDRFGCAVWLETHAPITVDKGKRQMRPRGSGIWSQWPEFGIALLKGGKRGEILELDRFRGDREEGRLWPERLTRNEAPGPCWPWTATYPPGTFMDRLGEEGTEAR